MKIRIEGCTAEKLAEHSDYLSLGTVYDAEHIGGDLYSLTGDDGQIVETLVTGSHPTSHLPNGAKWEEVTE